jgi:hypothetical protein
MCVRNKRELTARTLNNEVLPAFCKPIIVISISVALQQKQETMVSKHSHNMEMRHFYNGTKENRGINCVVRQRTTNWAGRAKRRVEAELTKRDGGANRKGA